MVNKLVIVGVVGFVAIAAIASGKTSDKGRPSTFTKIRSHVSAWTDSISKQVDESVDDPDLELKRIRNEVAKLDKDMEKVKGDLAEVRCTGRVLQADVEKLQADSTQLDKLISAHGSVLKKASRTDTIEWGNRLVSYTQAKDLLEREVQRYRRLKEDLAKKTAELENTEKAQEQIQEEIEAMKTTRDDLNREVADMDSLIKQAHVEQVRSKYQDDGSRMAGIKLSLKELRARVMVQREKLNVEDEYGKSIPKKDRTVEEILADKEAKKEANKPVEVKIATKE